MTYRDTWVTCTECGKEFIFRVEEQRRQARQGDEVTQPELCPSCRSNASRRQRPQRKSSASTAERGSGKPGIIGAGPHEGSVKWYDTEKGYGFIVHPSGEEIFFHRTGIVPGEVPNFPDGTRVTYLVEQAEKGPRAVDVERMNTENSE